MLALQALACGDVLHHGDEVVRRSRRRPHQRDGEVAPDDRPVLAHVALVQLVLLNLARQQVPDVVEVDVEVVGMGEVLPGQRREFRPVVAQQVAEPLVDAQPAPLRADVGDADRRALERRAEEPLARGPVRSRPAGLARGLGCWRRPRARPALWVLAPTGDRGTVGGYLGLHGSPSLSATPGMPGMPAMPGEPARGARRGDTGAAHSGRLAGPACARVVPMTPGWCGVRQHTAEKLLRRCSDVRGIAAMLQDRMAQRPRRLGAPAAAAPTWIGRQVRIGRESLGLLAGTRSLPKHRALSRLWVRLNSQLARDNSCHQRRRVRTLIRTPSGPRRDHATMEQ